MSVTIGVIREHHPQERRVATTPGEVKRLCKPGVTILVEQQAGLSAGYDDQLYAEAGASLVDRATAMAAKIVLVVQAPDVADLQLMRRGSLLIGFMNPYGTPAALQELAKQGIDACAMELIPRISRAQSMDALSSQGNIGGYRAVIEALHHYGRFVPLMMTSAGTARPARIVVLGVGVAGLQAIATARRMGGQVEAFDVRAETREQVISLGAKFIDIDLGEQGEGEGGYAQELSATAKQRQQAGLMERLKQADIIITTALIPGKPAPVLVTEEVVQGMRAGSVIIDMAAANGGNCPLSEADQVVNCHGVTIVGDTNLPARLASGASSFYGRNLTHLIELLLAPEEAAVGDADPAAGAVFKLDLEDEIIAGCLAVHQGEVRFSAPS